MQTIPLLSVSPSDTDHAVLRELLDGTQWLLSEARTLGSALAMVRQNRIPLVVCERNLPPDTWKDLSDRLAILTNPPSLIVTSRHADDQLWVEALSSGAYDLLAKPFNAREFHRTLFQAWLRWQVQFETANPLLEPHEIAVAV
ncbi:MAG: response regulator [Acidobacteriia bacterium]|nr:response regulator [Terriglobia bacterium]